MSRPAIIEPSTFADWAALLTIITTLIIASASGLWSAFVRSQENGRAEWRRIEELVQIVHHGSIRGLWAQKLAVEELLSLKRDHERIRRTLKEMSAHFRTTGGSGSKLADHIDGLLEDER